jgi:O-glycosyl hydrolase
MKNKQISTSLLKLLFMAICIWVTTFNMQAQVTVTARGEINAGEGIAKLTDGNLTNKWLDTNNTSWVKFAYATAQKWNQYAITSGNDVPGRDPKNWTLSGSNNGTTWTVLDTRTNETWNSIRNSTKTYQFGNSTSYLYYKWDITSNNGEAYIQVSEFAFGFKTDINIAQFGTGNVWQNLANTGTNNTIVASAGVNDGNTGIDVLLTNTTANDRYQAVGVIWANAQTNINRVNLYLGANPFTGAIAPVVQTSASGGTVANDWVTVSGWTFTPAYPANGVGAANKTYTITGPKITASVKGIRVAGQIAVMTAPLIVREIQVDGDDATPPTQPGAPVASNLSSFGLTLTWPVSTDNTAVASYEVFRDGTISCGTTTSNTLNISQLTASTSYSFTVVAKDIIGLTSVASAPLVVSTTAYVVGSLGYIENFNDNTLTGWTAGSYGLTEADGVLKIVPNKAGVWDGFDFKYTATQLDISTAPYVSMKIKSNFDFNIWIAVGNTNGTIDNYPLKFNNTLQVGVQEIVASDVFQEYSFDYTGVPLAKLQTANNLHFVLNPLARVFGDAPNKEIIIDDIKIGDLAVRTPAISTIQEQVFTAQASGTNPRTVKFRNVTDGSTGTNPITITATSSNTAVIPNPTVNYTSPAGTGSLVLNPNVLATGESLISVTVSAANTTPKVMTFKVKVVPNAAPNMQPIPNVLMKRGQTLTLGLTNISDNNPESTQEIAITAVSSNTDVLTSVTVAHNPTDFVGTITLKAAALAAIGSIPMVTVTSKDNGGVAAGGVDTGITTFTVSVYEEINNKPTIDSIPAKSIKAEVGNDNVQLMGISDGDKSNQTLTFEATASNNDIVTNLSVGPVVNGVATLSFTKTGAAGTATITVKVTDNGGNAGNNGNQSFSRTFQITSIIPPVNGIATNYVPYISNVAASGVRTDLTNGVITFGTDNSTHITGKVLAYNFPSSYFDIKALTGGKELDISANKRVSFKLKSASTTLSEGKPLAETVITFRLIDNIAPSADANSPSGYAVSAIGLKVPNDDQWHDYYLDFTGKFSSVVAGVLKSTDSTRISRIMLDINLTYFKEETVDVIFKDLKLGDMADLPIPAPKATINNISNQTLYVGDAPKPILMSGISDGSGNKTANITVSSNKPSLITGLTVGTIADGTAILNYSVAPGVADSAIVTVIVKNLAVATSIPDTTKFKIYVVDKSIVTASTVTIGLSTTYQIIGGIGCFLQHDNSDAQIQAIKDHNITALRFTCEGNSEFEPVNDNADPTVTNYSGFKKSILPLAAIRNINENTNCHKFNYTVWTPPSWMKQNKAGFPDTDTQWAANNRLKPDMYEEFAEFIVAICQTVKQEAGVELYAISLQNEPTFNEPYVSCQYNGAEFRELMKVVGPRMKAEGLSTRIMLSEDVNQMSWVQSNVGPTQADAVANSYLGILACHLYDPDGIKAGGAGATVWNSLLAFKNTTNAEALWMTETSGYSNVWEGEMVIDYLLGGKIYAPGPLDFAGSMYTSFKNGNISGWTDLDSPLDKSKFDLLGGVFKNYSKYIGPGSVMVSATANNNNVLPLAFKNADNSNTVILLNTSSKPVKVTLAGANVPVLYEKYTTQNAAAFVKGENVTDGTLLLAPRSITTLYHAVSNSAPTIDQPANQSLVLNEGEKVLTLTGIGYGADEVAQTISSVTATSSNTTIANVTILSTNGGSADLKITPVSLGTTTVTVKVKDDGGVAAGGIDETTITFTVTVKELTGINVIKKSVLSLYPNPANDFITINLENETANQVVITDLSGRIVQQQSVSNQTNNFKLSVNHLSKGIYFVTVKMKSQSQTIRLIHQ